MCKAANTRLINEGKYECTADLLFDWIEYYQIM